jgi:uncharacterized protein (TIGR03000 family)
MRTFALFCGVCAAALLGFPSIGLAQHGHGHGHSSGGGQSSSSGSHMNGVSGSANAAVHPSSFYNQGAHPSQLPAYSQGAHPSQLPAYSQGAHASQLPAGGWYHGGYYPYHPYYNPGLYWTAFGLSAAARLFSYPWGYSRYDYGYGAPYYQGGYYYGPPEGYAAAPTAPTDQAPPADPYHESTDPHVTNVEIRLPANATLWINGQASTTTGAVRHFYSPPLAEGETYTYEFHAGWTDANGRPVERTKNLDVKAGSFMGVDFNRPDESHLMPPIHTPMHPVGDPVPVQPLKAAPSNSPGGTFPNEGPPRRTMPPVDPPTYPYDGGPANPVPFPSGDPGKVTFKVTYAAYGDHKKANVEEGIRTAKGN